jgi:protease-4
VADEIFLPPGFGGIEFNGLSAEVTFFKGTLDKLEVEPQIFRVGEFKSAVEPFMRKDMSPASRKQIEVFINTFNDHILAQIAESRGLEVEYLRNVADSMLIRVSNDALIYKLADREVYGNELEVIMKEKLGINEDDEIGLVSYRKYNKSYSDSKFSKDRIAVIIGEGAITSGKGTTNSIGSDKFASLIKGARENDRIKAIVLRVNSPGGGALASDIMWNEIRLAAKEKPVIASMSDVAASGGYYIAMGCNKIVAMPTTITGSIGIFGMIFNIEKLMENKLGITTDRVTTGHFSDIYTMTRPLSEYERSIIQGTVEEGYKTFTTKAAEGRGMQLDDLLKVASGRIWSGMEAKEVGLIDEFGSLEDAIDMAADMAGVEDYLVRYYPEQKTVLEQLVEDLSNDMQTKILKWQAGDMYSIISTIKELESFRGIQARMLYDIKID